MPDAPRMCFTGDYAAADGRRVVFWVWAQTHAEAEAAVEAIGTTGRIVGELVEDGDGWAVTEAGRA